MMKCHWDIIEGHCDDYLKKLTRSYVAKIQEDTRSDKNKSNTNLFDNLNYISVLSYEGITVSGKVLLVKNPSEKECLEILVKFKEKIAIDNYRRIRKLLEIADEKLYLIGDSEYFYGFGEFSKINKIDSTEQIFTIYFRGRYYYEINFISVIKNLKRNVESHNNEKKEMTITTNESFKIEEHRLLTIMYGNPKFKKSEYSSAELKKHLKGVFGDKISSDNIIKLEKIIDSAKEQKHGTMVVITPHAKEEADSLKNQSIPIDKSYLDMELIKKVTSIDGAILLDIEGNCYAIGVILDGLAVTAFGDPGRGARYNSAIRYAQKESMKNNCLIIVISEDGMINIIPELKKDSG